MGNLRFPKGLASLVATLAAGLAILLGGAVPGPAQEAARPPAAAENPATGPVLAPPGGSTTNQVNSIAAVIALTTNQLASANYMASIEGVVYFVSVPSRRIYVQHDNEGIQVDFNSAMGHFKVGQRIAATGSVTATLPRNRLTGARARVLDEPGLPEALPSSAHRMATGQDYFRVARIRGVVRDMASDSGGLAVLLTAEGLPFTVSIRNVPAPESIPRHWLDAEVELTGFSYPYYTSAGKPDGFRFFAQDTNQVRILQPGHPSLFDRPLLTIAEASRLPRQWQPRVRIAGTVMLHRDNALYVDDGTGVMHVGLLSLLVQAPGMRGLEHEPQTQLEPGERVEVIGVRENWHFLAPMLLHAEFRRIGRGPEVKPLAVTHEDLRAGRHGGRLVSLEARLLDHRGWGTRNARHHLLVLQSGEHVFQASWSGDREVAWQLQPDSQVRVTGINEAQGGQFNSRPTFELRLRSPSDIAPAPEPPWWTRPAVRRPLLAAGGVGAVALAFILLQRLHLRRLEAQVARRTADLRGTNARLEQEVEAREEAEAELRVALAAEKELSRLKSSFVSMVSHEFRNPLEVILSSSHILDRYLDRLPPEKRREQLRAIRKSVHRMSDLMEDVLLLGKFEAARMTCTPLPLDLAAFCRRCCDEIESAAGPAARLHLDTSGLAGEARADETLLAPILTNLLGNAVKYSPPGSPVEFIVRRTEGHAEFVVRDRGCGIPAADRPRLFTAFHRASNVGQIPGSGLGLVIVQRCVELHGGTIQCDSTEGQGTTFTVTLPLYAHPLPQRRTPPEPPPAGQPRAATAESQPATAAAPAPTHPEPTLP